jgi:hypothetical protein
MNRFGAIVVMVATLCASVAASGSRAQSGAAQKPPPTTPQSAPQFDDWGDDFNGDTLDEQKWERFSFEGAGGGKLELKEGQLRLRSASKTRAGIRSKPTFTGERFSVEAQVVKVAPQLPDAGDKASDLGFAALTLLFDGAGRNRIEWVYTSEKTLEAWSVVDGRGERLDNRKLGLKFDRPLLAIIRRDDEFLFVVNKADAPAQDAQVALTKTIKNMPRAFHVMLYGFGSSENDWDSLRVVTAK